MTALLPVFAVFGVGVPAGCAVYSVSRWLLDRRALERAFMQPGRERRLTPNKWRQ